MTPPPLCIIQARLASTRLPQKMLCVLNGETLIARAHRMAVAVFGERHVVVAIPATDTSSMLGDELHRISAATSPVTGDENDVLSRVHATANHLRWSKESVIVRWTPDDPFKSEDYIRRVIAGERLPVELGCEAFSLARLDWAHVRETNAANRQHITHALFPHSPPPLPPKGIWTIDTQADLDAARALLADKPWPVKA